MDVSSCTTLVVVVVVLVCMATAACVIAWSRDPWAYGLSNVRCIRAPIDTLDAVRSSGPGIARLVVEVWHCTI